jgi:hypothetical protein
MDAGAAALEGGLRVRLYGGRRCGGGGFVFLAMWVARSGQQETLVLAVLQLWRLLDHVLEVLFGGSGRSVIWWYGVR